jgi:hypothetical protein
MPLGRSAGFWRRVAKLFPMKRQASTKARPPRRRRQGRWWRRLWLVGVAAYAGGLAGGHPRLAEVGAAVTVVGLFIMLWPRRPAEGRRPPSPGH